MTETVVSIPDGYAPHFRKSRFTDPWEPLYSKIAVEQVHIGVILTEAHCNSRGLVHGAFLAAIADNAIGLSCGKALKDKGVEHNSIVTTNLSIDYVGMASVGDWIATEIHVVKTGKTLCVASCIIESARGTVARANATFQIL